MTTQQIHAHIDRIERNIQIAYNIQKSILEAANVTIREELPNDGFSAEEWDNQFQIIRDLNDYIGRITSTLIDANRYIAIDLG